MKTVIAMDSFKGSLSSLQAGQAVADGFRRGFLYVLYFLEVCCVIELDYDKIRMILRWLLL